MRTACLVIATLAPLIAGEAAAQDPLCEQLRLYDAKPFDDPAAPIRSFRIAWMPDDDDVRGRSVYCRTSAPADIALCESLIPHVSGEFENAFPSRVLGCHGTVFGAGQWSGWSAVIDLSDDARLRYLEIALDGTTQPPEVRYTVADITYEFPEGEWPGE